MYLGAWGGTRRCDLMAVFIHTLHSHRIMPSSIGARRYLFQDGGPPRPRERQRPRGAQFAHSHLLFKYLFIHISTPNHNHTFPYTVGARRYLFQDGGSPRPRERQRALVHTSHSHPLFMYLFMHTAYSHTYRCSAVFFRRWRTTTTAETSTAARCPISNLLIHTSYACSLLFTY